MIEPAPQREAPRDASRDGLAAMAIIALTVAFMVAIVVFAIF